MACRGVRGAITCDANTREAVLEATLQLLALMIRHNGIEAPDVASALFTTTQDLDAEFPAVAARRLKGWNQVPMMCYHELDAKHSLGMCIRILIHWNTEKTSAEITPIYAKGAQKLRADLPMPPVDWDELATWIAGHSAETR